MTELNSRQQSYLSERAADYRWGGIWARVECSFLIIMGILGLGAFAVDWHLLTFLHETYAEEGYASSTFALSGLVVVFALHAVSTVIKSAWLERTLAAAAAVCGIVFIVGTCAMIGAIALTQGISGIGENLPDVEQFFGSAQEVVDEAFGTGQFEEIVLDFGVPLFTAAVTVAFFLTTYVLKFILGLLARRLPVVIRGILRARSSAALYGAIQDALVRERAAKAALSEAVARRAHWTEPRIADVIAKVVEEMLRPFDVIISERELTGWDGPDEMLVPHPDGGPALRLPELKKRLGDLRGEMACDEILCALRAD